MSSIQNVTSLVATDVNTFPLSSVEHWTSIEVLTNFTLAGIFLLLITLHHLSKWLFRIYGPQSPRSCEFDTLDSESPISDTSLIERFRRFQYRYILVYGITFSVDMFGAPYVYSMYSDYHHLDHAEIINLLRIGFLSIAMTACTTSPIFDLLGRRMGLAVCLLAYVVRYLLVAFTTYLRTAQICYGIGVSLLYSIPNAWMIDQHRILGFDDSLLQDTYLKSNIATSVLSVIVTQCAAWIRPYLGFSTIFCFASCCSLLNILLLFLLWEENLGYRPSTSIRTRHFAFLRLMFSAFFQIFTRLQILATGLSFALMDCTVWIVISTWTPSLTPLNSDAVFPGLMIASAMGSYFVSIITNPVDTQKIEPSIDHQDSVAATTDSGFGEWHAGKESNVKAEHQKRSTSITSIVNHLRHYGLPLRLSIILFQCFAILWFALLFRNVSLHVRLIAFICLEFYIGCHYSAFSNLKSQIFPTDGRLVISSFFDFFSGLLNYFVLGTMTHKGADLSPMFSTALIYSSIAVTLSLIAFIVSFLGLFSPPSWHPESLSIAISAGQKRGIFSRILSRNASTESSRFHNAVNAVSLFFRREPPSPSLPVSPDPVDPNIQSEATALNAAPNDNRNYGLLDSPTGHRRFLPPRHRMSA